MELIGLVDCNNFYVSCERVFRPDLSNRPVVVLSSNDGCVVARSQEIKDKGISMGVPYFQIKDILSDMKAVVFSSNFALYRDISKRVFNVLGKHLNCLEQYSIDEGFFRVNQAEAEEQSFWLQELIKRQIGIPVSVGIASSKTQAKYANHLAKKTNGYCLLTSEEWLKQRASIKLSEIWGVGQGRLRQFANYNLKTVMDFLAQSPSVVGQRFGIEGANLYRELTGEDQTKEIIKKTTPKSITNTASFYKKTTDKNIVLSALLDHLHELVRRLNETKTQVTQLKVLMTPSYYGDFALKGSVAEEVLTMPSSDIFVLTSIVTKLMERSFKANVPYKKAGIIALVVATEGQTNSLFADTVTTVRTKTLNNLLLDLNRHYGKNALRLGNIKRDQLTARRFVSPCYTTNWSDLKTVKAQ